MSRLGGHKELGGDTAGTADIPYYMMSCSVYKDGGRRRKGRDVWSDGVLTSQVTVRRDGALLSWAWLNTCLPMGRDE